MSRRLVNLTLDTLEDLPSRCRGCVFWELDPVAAERAARAGDAELSKEAWASQTLLEWGSCGKLIYVDEAPAGYVLFAPPAYVPRSVAFPTSPVSPDAVLLMAAYVVPDFAGGGLGRMLVQGVARDLTRRNIKAIEAFGLERRPLLGERRRDPGARVVAADEDASDGGMPGERSCVVPADFFRSVGFKTVRPHPRFPRLRMDLRTALSWKSDVEAALDKLLGSMRPEALLHPALPH